MSIAKHSLGLPQLGGSGATGLFQRQALLAQVLQLTALFCHSGLVVLYLLVAEHWVDKSKLQHAMAASAHTSSASGVFRAVTMSRLLD